MLRTWIGFSGVAMALAVMGCSTSEGSPEGGATDDLVARSTECRPLSNVPGMKIQRDSVVRDTLQLRIGTMDPAGTPKGDILFLHGFGDRFDNHLPLFEAWKAKGFRTIAFDFPSHGETCGTGIDDYRINGIAALAVYTEVATRQDVDRPLLLAGWSTGGLVVTRMLEAPEIAPLAPSLATRAVKGAILLAPAIHVPLVVGDFLRVTEETLTSDPNPPHRGEITPRSPVQTPLFAGDIILNAHHARNDPFPKNVPTVVVTGGDEDLYVKTEGVEAWVRGRQNEQASVYGIRCEGALHELDNEVAPIRDDVRDITARFAAWASGEGSRAIVPMNGMHHCRPY